jgi:mono/diheme cytochrome c family protein
VRASIGLIALSIALGSCALAQSLAPQVSNVPDVVTRQSGLRIAPMPRAARTYAANCQGCHGDLGSSAKEIPTLVGRVGYFVRSREGRRYLVQVPNVALNPSSDADIAAVLNWVLMTYSRPQLPESFRPYTAEEVGELRKGRIDVLAERQRIVRQLVAARLVPSADVLALPQITPY